MQKTECENLDANFKYDVAARPGGENVKLCFACGTCTAGCPVSAIDDEFDPRKIIRQVLLGMRTEVLSSPAIWRCVQCYSCTSKCPQNVKFREVMTALREMAVNEGFADASILQESERLGEFAQRLRRDLANAMVADRARYDEMKSKLEQITTD